VRSVCGALRIGASAASGSVAKTSSAAPPSVPAWSAAATASRSTISPREQLTRIAVGFSVASAFASMRSRVCGVSGVWSEMTSDSRSTVSRSTSVTPAARAALSVAYGSLAMTRISNAAARRATRLPTRPIPTSPSVFPRSSRPMNALRVHSPRRTLWSASTTCRMSASARVSACSAAAVTFPSGAFTT